MTLGAVWEIVAWVRPCFLARRIVSLFYNRTYVLVNDRFGCRKLGFSNLASARRHFNAQLNLKLASLS
jgi:hypothetical protein